MAKKSKRCKWCEAGYSVRSDGCHWIVKSIIPARINIQKCALATPTADTAPAVTCEGSRGAED